MYDSSDGEDEDVATTEPSSSRDQPVGSTRPAPTSPQHRQRDNKRPRRLDTTEGVHNSDDERLGLASCATLNGGRVFEEHATVQDSATLPYDETAFEEQLKSSGFLIKRMAGDGNCLFRAVADQVYGDSEMHDEVRRRCMDYMEKERDHYSQFVTEDFTEYLRRKRMDQVFGNHLEIQAICEIYNRPIEVYAYGHREPINIFHKYYFTDSAPIRLSYHYGNHYNAVIDPENPSVGVGLGLPELVNPGLEMERVIEQSIEDELYKDVVKASEWEATQKQLEEEILRQSAIEANVAPVDQQDRQLEEALRQSELEYWQSLCKQDSVQE